MFTMCTCAMYMHMNTKLITFVMWNVHVHWTCDVYEVLNCISRFKLVRCSHMYLNIYVKQICHHIVFNLPKPSLYMMTKCTSLQIVHRTFVENFELIFFILVGLLSLWHIHHSYSLYWPKWNVEVEFCEMECL